MILGLLLYFDVSGPGGGFGGRDESSLAMYLALAAFFADRPVRIAFDRYEQFQVGIKRHAAVVRNRLAWDRQGNLQALISTTLMDGGGEANLTMPVVGLAVLHAAGPYRIPRTALEGFGVRTPGSPSGSMREGLSCASSRKGSVSERTLDLPVPLLPRNNRCPRSK